MTIDQRLLLQRLHQLRDLAPSINSYLPPREKPVKSHQNILQAINGHHEEIPFVIVQEGMKTKMLWEVLDQMIRRYKFNLSNKDQYGLKHDYIVPPVKYRAKPAKCPKMGLGELF